MSEHEDRAEDWLQPSQASVRQFVERVYAERANRFKEASAEIRELDPRERLDCLLAAVVVHRTDYPLYAKGQVGKIMAAEALIGQLLTLRHPWQEQHIDFLAEQTGSRWCTSVIRQVLSVVRDHAVQHGLSRRSVAALKARRKEILRKEMNESSVGPDDLRLIAIIDEALTHDTSVPAVPGDVVADNILVELGEFEPATREVWEELFSHASSLSSSRPTQKWNRTAQALVERLGGEAVAERLFKWFRLVGLHGTRLAEHEATIPSLLAETNVKLLVGLIWVCAALDREAAVTQLVALARQAYGKVPHHGALSPKIGNACVAVIADVPSMDAIKKVALIRNAVANKVLLAHLDRVLARLAESIGFPAEYLDEIAVPAFDFGPDGTRTLEIDGHRALLSVGKNLKPTLQWLDDKGKPQKTVPVELQDSPEIVTTRNLVKTVGKALAEISHRIEQYLLARRTWTFADWKERYIDHPLVRLLATRLVWQLCDGSGTTFRWDGTTLLGPRHEQLEPPSPETRLILWHPVDASPEESAAWAEHFKRNRLVQPFQQVDRQVYRLADLSWKSDAALGAGDCRFDEPTFYNYFRKWGWTMPGLVTSGAQTVSFPASACDLVIELRTNSLRNEKAYEIGRPPFVCLMLHEIAFERPNGDSLPPDQVPAAVLSEVARHLQLVRSHASLVYE